MQHLRFQKGEIVIGASEGFYPSEWQGLSGLLTVAAKTSS